MKLQHSLAEAIAFIDKLAYTSGSNLISPTNPKFEKKVKNAIKAYASDVRPEQVFALYDDTVFGSAKEGFIMTMQGVVLSSKAKCDYDKIQKIKIEYDAAWKLTTISFGTDLGFRKISGTMGDDGSVAMAKLINSIVKYLFGLESDPYSIEKK